jgi:5'(3')-deoxyribonucleotidase
VKVCVDLDGVTLAFHARFEELYNLWFDREIDPEVDRSDWDWILTGSHFEKYEQLWGWFDRAGGWWNQAYVPGAPGGIDRLVSAGHEIVFGTARNRIYGAERPTVEWWRKSPWAEYSRLRQGLRDKSLTQADIYIDDSPAVIEQLVGAGKAVVIFDRPWNQDAEIAFSVAYGAPPVVRAHDWHEVTDHVRNIHEWEKELAS